LDQPLVQDIMKTGRVGVEFLLSSAL